MGNPTTLSKAAMRAACLLDACHALPEVGDRLDHRRFRWRPIGRRAGGRQSVLLARRREQAVVTDALETGRQDGFQKTVVPGARRVRFLPLVGSARTRRSTSLPSLPSMPRIRSLETATRCV